MPLFKEHDIEIPSWAERFKLVDTSWHNDAAACLTRSVPEWRLDPTQGQPMEISVWVNYPKVEQWEYPEMTRYWVTLGEEGESPLLALFSTNNEDRIIRFLTTLFDG